jgi:hypothetical protein
VKEVRSGRRFLEKHAMSAENYNNFKMWSNKLETLLFQQ